MSDDAGDDPLFFNVQTAMPLAREIGIEAYGLVMSLIFEVYWPQRQAFHYNAADLAARLSARGITAADLDRLRDKAARFFTVLPDGRWAPSPEFFSMTDGNPGRVS